MSDDVKIPETRLIPLEDLAPVEWNPNQESDAVFAHLVENIREIGFIEPLQVLPRADGKYEIIGGEHRWRAAQVLKMEAVPCTVLEVDDKEYGKIINVRMNMLKGKMDPFRFTKLFNELTAKYGPDGLRRLMALTEEGEFKRLYKDVRQALPPEVRKRLDSTKHEMKNVDDLAMVLKSIFATHGSQLDHGFIVFSFGGQDHIMVKASPRTRSNLYRIGEECLAKGEDIKDRICQLLESYEVQ